MKNPTVEPVRESIERLPRSAICVVGIGASMGGLGAFTQLLSALEPNTGMAFVLIQHLSPSHISQLTELLTQKCRMPVIEVADEMMIRADHVYVMPENVEMRYTNGALALKPREPSSSSLHFPIDVFLVSLAQALGSKAIGVILSGTGEDGKKGVEAIVAAGGTTFAQSDPSAESADMPTAAREAGAKFNLSPAAIGRELGRLHPASDERPAPDERAPSDERPAPDERLAVGSDAEDLQRVLGILSAAKNVHFSHYKLPTIQRRVERRVRDLGLASVRAYGDALGSNPSEIDSLFEEVFIKVTSFFRGAESFTALTRVVFPALLDGIPRTTPIRIWVPGCSSGQEAYSIAMCLLEFMDGRSDRPRIEIFATDISLSAIEKARAGLYDSASLESVSAARLERFFVKDGTGHRVSADLREMCIFAKQNVAFDPPFSRIDLVSCRNLMIYLTPEVQTRVLSVFYFALVPDGFLCLGGSESITSCTDLFGVADGPGKVFFRKAGAPRGVLSDFVINSLRKRSSGAETPDAAAQPTKKLDMKALADEAILGCFVPPGVVVNERMEVLEVRGDPTPFLLFPPGELTASLAKMCRPGLLVELRQAFHAAEKKDVAVRREAWIKSSDGTRVSVEVNVVPFTEHSTQKRYFVVLFAIAHGRKDPKTRTEAPARDVERVEREPSETKDYLSAIIEKEQSTNIELKSLTEEMLSANEELQSTNEELATSKEETQATNEELATVNAELQLRNQELGVVNSDLSNVLGGVQIPIFILSEQMLVRRFTQAAEKVFRLTAADLGRPFADVVPQFRAQGVPALVSEVLSSLETKETEIQDGDGRWYSLRVRPYRSLENRIEGAIVVLVDIDTLKLGIDRLTEAHAFAEAIVQTTPVPLLVLDADLSILTVNDVFCRHFKIKEREAQGVRIYDLAGGQWNVPRLRELLEDILPSDAAMENFVVEHDFPNLGRLILRLSARRLVQKSERTAKILLAIEDLTKEKRAAVAMTTALEAADAANRSKSDFLANVSHEIRTPLGAILGYSERMVDSAKTADDTLSSVTGIRRNVDYLTNLIDEILDIGKKEAGKFEVERVPFLLLPELAEAFSPLLQRAKDSRLSFEVNFDGALPETIVSCPRRLRQILFNLIGNALKFTKDGGVWITIDRAPSGRPRAHSLLRFRVRDTGCGLTPGQQERLFVPFSQADSSVTRRFGGTGLGLALARRLAEALGGDVVLLQSSPNCGSTFEATLDPGPLHGVKMRHGLKFSDLEEEKQTVQDWFRSNQLLAGKAVLLVEDGPDNQEIFSHYLTASGASVDLAADGNEGVEKARAGIYDLVLMDLQMPHLDGYAATAMLRAGGYALPIVALSAHAMRGDEERCLAAGCDAYLRKPILPTSLIDACVRAIRNKPK